MPYLRMQYVYVQAAHAQCSEPSIKAGVGGTKQVQESAAFSGLNSLWTE